MLYLFGDYTLDTQLYELRYQESPCPLEPQVFNVLLYLLQHHDRIVTKQELLEHVWPGRFISEATLDHRIMEARQAVGDSGHRQRSIKTVRGRGYRFIAALEMCDTATQRLSSPSASPPLTQALAEEGPNRVVTPDSALSGLTEIGEIAEAVPQSVTPLLSSDRMPPGAARGQGRPQTATAEWKQVTVLCCTLTEVQGHTVRLEPEERYRFMQAFFALAQPVLQRFEGTLIHAMNDGFMALFGAPVAHEDHVRRAVLAAHALQQHLAGPGVVQRVPMGDTFKACIGLHTGLVVVGNLGDDAQQNYIAVGDTPLLATRLCALAEPGAILLSAITQQFVQEEVQVEAYGTIAVAGRAATMPVYRVRDIPRQRAGVLGHGARMWSRFVGRERELALLHERLTHVRDEQGQVVGIVGDPGMGKSRLLTEFHQSLDAMAVQYCEGHCFPYTIATPYLPVLDLLRQICGISAADSPEVMTAKVVQQLQAVGLDPEVEAPVLLAILDVPVAMERLAMLSPQARKARIFALLLQMSLHRSQQQPLILAVENVHWIDATSEEWLTTLVERLTGAAILLLVTSRPGYHASWLEQAVVTRLALPPLLPDESLAVVQSVLHTEHLPEPLVPEILTKAAGNPFFLEELAWSIVEHGPQQGPLTVPDTIQSVLAARIDRLPPAEKQLLQVAAVIGKELTFALLQAVTALPEAALHTSLRRLQNAEFLHETRTVPVLTYTFKHALTQEVAYQSLLKSTRQQQHQTIAQVLETQFPDTIEIHPELLAHHYTEAGVAVAAVAYWQRAGRRAYERSANREAISYLTNGLEILQTLPDTSAQLQQEILLQSTLGAAYTAARGYAAPEVEQAYNRARALCQQAGDPRQLFPILVGLWNFYFVRSASQIACELGEQLLAMAQQAQDPARLLRAHAALGEILFHTGNLVQARHHLEQGMALYNPQQHHSHAVQTPTVACLAYVAWTLWQQGYPDQAVQRCQEARELAQELSHPLSVAIALTFTGIVHQFRREAPAAQEWNEAATKLAQTQGFPFWEASAMIVWGWALAMQGQHTAGIAQIQRGLEIFQTTGAAVQMPSWLALLAEAYALDGQIAAGQRAVDEALTILNRTGERYYEAELYRLKGDLFLQLPVPDTSQAEACLQQALAVARRQGARAWELRAAISLCRLWQRQGKNAAALRLLAPLHAWFTEGWHTADLQEAKALLEALATPEPAETAGVTPQPTPNQERLLAVPFSLPPTGWEHKSVVVLAVSLVFPSLTAPGALDADPWTLTSRWTQQIVETVEALDGVVLQRSPALLTAAFGLPRALDEMPQRAVQAAVTTQRLTAETSAQSGRAPRPEMRWAVHLGEVLVDVQASDPTTQVVAVGETLTLPVQLLGHTRPGEILLSSQLAPWVETLYRLEARPLPRTAAASHVAYAVVGQQLQPVLLTGLRQRPLSPFVGRERELDVLHERYAQASAGQGQVVAMVGPAGIGKSRLLEEFRRGLQGASVTYLEGQCRAYGRNTPYFPLHDLVRQHCGIAAMDSPDVMTAKVHGTLRDVDVASETWAQYLLALLGVRAETERLAVLSSEAIKIRTFEALRLLTMQSSQQRPLIVAIENMHWSDSTSEAYLDTLVEHLPTVSVLLLVTYRSEYCPPWSATPAVTTFALPMLSPDDSRHVVQAGCQTVSLPDAVVQEILCRAEGNPFFLEELVRAVSQDGPGQTYLGTVPDTIQGVLMARIDRLPDATRWCLQTAAVLGREAHHGLLTAVWSGPGDLEAHMQTLQQLEFLHVDTEAGEPVYRFTHALTQEVAYESVPLPRRQVLHTAIGRVLEAFYADRLEVVADRLAYHYTRGVEAEKAVTFLTLCAEKAVRTHAHTEAATAFEEALAQAARLPKTERERRYLELTLRQAFSWSFLGRFRETLERLLPQQAALERLADATLAGSYYFRLALTYWVLGEQEQAMQSAYHALVAAQRGHDVAILGKAHYVRALVEYSSGQFQQAIADGWQSVEFLAQIEEWHYLGLMYWILGLNYGLHGEFAPALDALARVANIGAATGDPRLQSFAAWSTGWIAVLRGEWDAGIAGCQRGLDLATDPFSKAFAANYLGFAYLDSGQPAQAMPLLQQAVEQFCHFRYLQGQTQATTWLGEAWLLNGDLATARVLAQQGLELSRKARYVYGVGLAQRALGRIAHASGALAEAEHYYTDALETFTTLSAQYELGRTYLDLATLAHTQGNRVAVATYLTTARTLFETLQVPTYVERTAQLARAFEVCGPAGPACRP